MSYCEICGHPLELKELKNEGLIPFCSYCQAFRFKKFNVAVSMVVVSHDMKRALLIEQYGKKRYILVAGYVNIGESAEEACHRELLEEVNLKIHHLLFQKTKYFEKTNTLMMNYIAVVDHEDVTPNEEIDSYRWFSIEEAKQAIAERSLAQEFYLLFYEKVKNHEL